MARGKKKTSFNFNKKKTDDTVEVLQPSSDKVDTRVLADMSHVMETDEQMDIDPIETPEVTTEDLNNSCRKVENSAELFQHDLLNKISIVKSDITKVKCDAIVNAANSTLLGGGGIDKVIHKAAGPALLKKCKELPTKGTSSDGQAIRCYPGQCEVTSTAGTKLKNCKYVFHTVGPNVKMELDMNHNATVLRACYESCLQNVLDYNISSIAFCCISTGIYGYDNTDAATIAWDTVLLWLEKYHQFVTEIIFCTYISKDYDIYNNLSSGYFPISASHVNSAMHKRDDGMSVDELNLNPSASEKNISSDIDFDLCPPIGLQNRNHNVCFFNSIVQILISFPAYQSHIMGTMIDNPVISTLRALFDDINHSVDSVYTFDSVKSLELPGYVERNQHDVHECLLHVLEKSYPTNELQNSSIFNIQCTRTNECECGKIYDKRVTESIFQLDTEDSEMFPSVQMLLDRTLSQYGVKNEEFQCRGNLDNDPNTSDRGCGKIGTCTEYTAMNVPGDILIIQLQVFRWNENLSPYKYIPKIVLNEQLICSDSFELTGIVWHTGDRTNSGHYTSNVKIGNTWFYTDDAHVTEGLKEYSPANITLDQDIIVPYLLVYKKINRTSVPLDSSSSYILPNSEINPESMNGKPQIKGISTKSNRVDDFDQDDCISTKRTKLETNLNENVQTVKGIEKMDSLLEVHEEPTRYDTNESVCNIAPREFNFGKR